MIASAGVGRPRNISRRTWLRQAGVAALGWASRAAARGPAASALFDIHTHLGQTWNTTLPLSAGELLRWMDAHAVAQAAVLPLVSPEASSFPLSTEFVLRETAGHRDRLAPFCAVDPRTSIQGGRTGLRDVLRRYRDAGALGFGEHKPGLAIDDPRNLELLAACGQERLPVLFHLDNERNTDHPGLPGLERVLTQLPEVVLIGHGPGWWASISAGVAQADLGGYPKGAVQPGGAIERLFAKYPRLYGDLSAGSGAGALARDVDFARVFCRRWADRLLFGSDFLSPGQEVPQFEVLERLELPDDAREAIARGNARRLLGLN